MNSSLKIVNFSELFRYEKSYILGKLNRSTFDKLQEFDFFNEENGGYKFNHVGILIIDKYIIRIYPKYFLDKNYFDDNFKEIINVIKKFKKEEGDLDYEIDDDEKISNNILSIMVHLLEDYYENGVYTNFQKILKTNGTGEINWDKTINNNYPIIKDNNPYYMDLYTNDKINDLYDYFHLLHKCVLTQCSKILKEYDLLDLFDLSYLDLSDKSIDNFGDMEFILNKIEKELHIQFNSQKQKILKLMEIFISKRNFFHDKNSLILYGTQDYDVIWESMCSKVFGNIIKSKLNTLNLPKYSYEKYDYDKTLRDIIETPKWILKDGTIKDAKKNKLKHDLIIINEKTFIILDAKYYNLVFEKDKEISGQPGISDITKQYLYQLVLDDFIKDHCFTQIKNALLFPKYSNGIKNKGIVKLDIFKDLKNIQVILLPANEINKLYLEGNDENKFEFLSKFYNALEDNKDN